MTLGIVEWYLIAISIIGFILYGVNTLLYHSSSDKQIDVVITLVSMLGGSLGIVLFILLFDRKSVKDKPNYEGVLLANSYDEIRDFEFYFFVAKFPDNKLESFFSTDVLHLRFDE